MQSETTKLEQALDHCRSWAAEVGATIGVESVHIFGSAIYKNGTQFDAVKSDLDLVIRLPSALSNAVMRTDWLERLRSQKQKLELSLIPILGRVDAGSPIVSIVAITDFELERDIHKSGARDFFQVNDFLSLLDKKSVPAPLLNITPTSLDERGRQAIQFTQDTRNKYLGVSASGKAKMVTWSDTSDPLPKELMRQAAAAKAASASASSVTSFDVQVGLDHISSYLQTYQSTSKRYAALFEWLSVRRGARGTADHLTVENHLLFADIIFDMVSIGFGSPETHNGKVRKGSKATNVSALATAMTRINAYKLFYFRTNHKLSFSALSRLVHIDRSLLRRLEKLDPSRRPLDVSRFATCDSAVLAKLENILDCRGKLEVGRPDDFLTQYMMFYENYKGLISSNRRVVDQIPLAFETKAVVFDFDGTLTQRNDSRTTWEMLWTSVGYTTERCFELHHRFRRNEFDHQQWCDITLDAFREKKMNQEHVQRVSEEMRLIDGIKETTEALRKSGIRLFIVSGSIKTIIRHTLGSLAAEFEEIRANEIVFGPDGIISEIQGTPYDFEGKALFLRRIIKDLKISPSDVLFIGNSCNDIFASQSGARTLCVNPRFTDPDNEAHWTYAIRDLKNLKQILKYVQI